MIFGVTSEMFVNGGLTVACALLSAVVGLLWRIATGMAELRTRLAVQDKVTEGHDERMDEFGKRLDRHDERLEVLEASGAYAV